MKISARTRIFVVRTLCFFAQDGGGFVKRKPAGEDTEPPEKRLFAFVEQVVTPGDRVAEGTLSVRQVARAAGQQRQPAVEPGGKRGRWQHLDPRGGKLDR